MSVVDLFKDRNEIRPKAKYDYNQGITSYSNNVYAKNFTPSYVRNSANTFSKIVKNEDLKEIKLIDNNDSASCNFPIQANNRVEYFYNIGSGKKVDYKEVIKVEDYTPSEYGSDITCQLKRMGFTSFYQLYVKHEMNKNLDVKLSILATR